MNYEILDPILESWARRHDLHIHRMHRDDPVRSLNVVSPAGQRFQMWLDPPSEIGDTAVHGWDFKDLRIEIHTIIEDLEKNLELVYREIVSNF